MLGRFQNFTVPVLNFFKHSVPVSTGFLKSLNFGTGSREFGSTVLTVLNMPFFPWISRQNLSKINFDFGVRYLKFGNFECVADFD